MSRDSQFGSGDSPPHRRASRPGTHSAADHLAFVSNESGSWQAWVTDRTARIGAGSRTSRSASRAVLVAPDGRVVWWRDDTGDERGRWMAVPFEGGEPEPFVPGDPPRLVGRDLVRRRHRCGRDRHRGRLPGDRRGAGIGPPDRPDGPDPAWASGGWIRQGRGGLSADGRLVCLRHTEAGDILHHALMVLDAADGTVMATLVDPGSNLDPTAWSPRPGDERLLFTSELGAFERPAIWDAEDRRASRPPRRPPRRRDPGGMVARRLRDPGPARVRGRVRAAPAGSGAPARRRSSPTRGARSPTPPCDPTARCGSRRATACTLRAS